MSIRPTAVAAVAVAAAVALVCLTVSAEAAGRSGPTAVTPPAVTGVAKVDSPLTGSPGSWAGSGSIGYAYQWQRCDAAGAGCVAIAGATKGDYTPQAADAGKTLALTVTATDSTGKTSRGSSLIGPLAPSSATLASAARPTVAGTVAVGSKLAVSTGTWTTLPKSFAYAWLRCDGDGRSCVAISGATASTYTPVAADGGHVLVARVTATAGGASQAVLSLETAELAQQPGQPQQPPTSSTPSTSRPTIAGAARVGQRLSGAAPPGTPTADTTAFQWYRCDPTGAHCKSVHGATGKSYTEVGRDVGKTIALTVKVTSGTTVTPTYSSLLGPVAAATAPAVSTVQPAVTGQAVQGQTLTATAGTWSKTPDSVRYAWQRCNANGRICIPLDGATSATYTPVAADVGHALVALVLATFGSTTQSAFSLATQPVVASLLAATAPPTVSGTLRVKQKLTGAPGTWTGAAPIAYHYQWYRCDTAGAHCHSVHGATGSGYTLVAKDVGHTIGLTVTATDATGSKKPAYASLAGPVVAATAPAASVTQPKLSGSPVVGEQLSVDAGTWTATPTTETYQWERCNVNGRLCAPIPGATSAAYTVAAADDGHALLALVTATVSGEATGAFSLASPPATAS